MGQVDSPGTEELDRCEVILFCLLPVKLPRNPGPSKELAVKPVGRILDLDIMFSSENNA